MTPALTPELEPGTGHIPFGRLLRVETRKLFDTRSSMIMTGLMAVLALALVAGRAVVLTEPPKLFTLAGSAAIALGILLPVLAVLTVTAEWSHRTALTTFALEPRRARILAAKCLPALGTAVVACLFALVAAVPATAVAAAVRGVEPSWNVAPQTVLGWITVMVLMTAQGLAMGLLLLNAPAAIVICMAGTALWSFVAQLGEPGETLAAWLDLNATTNPLMGGTWTWEAAARLATSVLAWIVIPGALGFLRVVRKDVN
ncbi:hypothetical protein ACIBO5_02585 [Nonomuraea angiospora]|uniref:hypothetical protein n=1 Tax=Nonomuraea angiospora TaxID=46172 RepID=UPI0037AFE9B2